MAESIGSIRATMSATFVEIPTSLSGNVLGSIIDRTRLFIQNYTGDTVSSTDVPEKYQQPLIDLSAAALLTRMEMLGVDATTFRLGDFSETVGGESNITSARLAFQEQGMLALQQIGTLRFHMGKANG